LGGTTRKKEITHAIDGKLGHPCFAEMGGMVAGNRGHPLFRELTDWKNVGVINLYLIAGPKRNS
jgi:hypothetical protein